VLLLDRRSLRFAVGRIVEASVKQCRKRCGGALLDDRGNFGNQG
jgi:hypothetical protein